MNKYKAHSRIKEASSCIRKRTWNSPEEAMNALQRTGAKSYYKCKYCSGWHLSSALPKTTR